MSDKIIPKIFITFRSDLLDLLSRDPSSNKFPVDSSEVSSNEAVCLKQVLKFIEKPVWARSDKMLEVFNIRDMKYARAATNTICLLDNLSRSIPECRNTVKSSR